MITGRPSSSYRASGRRGLPASTNPPWSPMRPAPTIVAIVAATTLVLTASACTKEPPNGEGVIQHSHSPTPSPSAPKTYPIPGTNPTKAKDIYSKKYHVHFRKKEVAMAKATDYISSPYSIDRSTNMTVVFTVVDRAPNGPLIDAACLAQANKGQHIKNFKNTYSAVASCLNLLLPEKSGDKISDWLLKEFPKLVYPITKDIAGFDVEADIDQRPSSSTQFVKAQLHGKTHR